MFSRKKKKSSSAADENHQQSGSTHDLQIDLRGIQAESTNPSTQVQPTSNYTSSPYDTSNYNGTDQFTYTVSDNSDSLLHTVIVTVDPVNDSPVLISNAASSKKCT